MDRSSVVPPSPIPVEPGNKVKTDLGWCRTRATCLNRCSHLLQMPGWETLIKSLAAAGKLAPEEQASGRIRVLWCLRGSLLGTCPVMSQFAGLLRIDLQRFRIDDYFVGVARFVDADKFIDHVPAYFFRIALRRLSHSGTATADLVDDISGFELIHPVAVNPAGLTLADEEGFRVGRGLTSESTRRPHPLSVGTAGGHARLHPDILILPVDSRSPAPCTRPAGILGKLPALTSPGEPHLHFLDISLVHFAQGANRSSPFVAVKSPRGSGPTVHVESRHDVFLAQTRVETENVVAIAFSPAGDRPVRHCLGHSHNHRLDDLMAHVHGRSSHGGRILRMDHTPWRSG